MNIIEDGTGKGYQAKVDSENRIQSFATSISESQEKTIVGNAFTVGTSMPIDLTGTTESAVLFFDNNGDDDIVVTNIFVLVSGTTAPVGVSIVRNPNAITPDTGTKGGSVTNSNFGSSNLPNITVIDGEEGATFQENNIWNYYFIETAYFSALGPFVLSKGSNFGVGVTQPSNNISMNINVGFSFYTKEKNGK